MDDNTKMQQSDEKRVCASDEKVSPDLIAIMTNQDPTRKEVLRKQSREVADNQAKLRIIAELDTALRQKDFFEARMLLRKKANMPWLAKYTDFDVLRKFYPDAPLDVALTVAVHNIYRFPGIDDISALLKKFFADPTLMLFSEFVAAIVESGNTFYYVHIREMAKLGATDEMFAMIQPYCAIPANVADTDDLFVSDVIKGLLERKVLSINQ